MGRMSNVAIFIMKFTRKLAFAGNCKLNKGKCVESCSPLIMLHKWFKAIARAKFITKLPPITDEDATSLV